MIDRNDAEFVLGAGGAVRGVAAFGAAAVSSRGKARLEKIRTERIVTVIKALPPGGEWSETTPDGWSWSVRLPSTVTAR